MHMDSKFYKSNKNKNNTLCGILETRHVTKQPTVYSVALYYEK